MGISRALQARHGGRSGVVLLLISGVVTILVLLSLLMLQMSRAFVARAAALAGAAQAQLAAESGMDYAAARLCQDSMPGRWDVPGRADDWTERQGPGNRGQGSDNPSYSHGEGWIEAGTPDGIFTPNETAGPDRDGEGRFSAWSGRLRGGPAPCALRFALRIECAEGKILLNAGSLAAGESDSLGKQYHASLAMVLNNLGVLAGVSTRRWNVPAAVEPIEACWIGTDLLLNRPTGGYRSWADVERTLTALPDASPFEGAPYRREDLEAIRPFVDLDPSSTMAAASRCVPLWTDGSPPYIPINLWTAPRAVIEAAWRYLMARSPAAMMDLVGFTKPSAYGRTNDLEGSFPSGALCPHSGLPFGPAYPDRPFPQPDPPPVPLILWPEEARELAARAMTLRRSRTLSWGSLRQDFAALSPRIFAGDAAALAGYPDFRRSWLLCKADLAFQAVAMDPYPYRGAYDCLSTWATWGIDADTSADGAQCPPVVGADEIFRVVYPDRFDPSGPPAWPWPGDPAVPYRTLSARVRPQGFTLAQPGRFEVASLAGGGPGTAGACLRSGRLTASERLELTSQEDFDNTTSLGSTAMAKRGILLSDPLPAERFGCPAGTRTDPAVISLPHLHNAGSSRSYGALSLAGTGSNRDGAGLYWGFRPDLDGAPRFLSESGPEGIFYPGPFSPPKYFPPLLASAMRPGAESPEASTPLKTTGLKSGASLWIYGQNAYQFSEGDVPAGLSLPWYDPAGPLMATIPAASIEAWMAPVSMVRIEGANMASFLKLRSERAWRDPDQGVLFKLHVEWMNPLGEIFPTDAEWFVPDPASADRRVPWSRHVMLTWEEISPEGTPFTRFTLYVDGAAVGTHDRKSPVSGRGELSNALYYHLRCLSVDELRFYRTLEGAKAATHYALGRFKKSGTFRSPLYVLDAHARLLAAQWTGVSPVPLEDAAGNAVQPFRVSVEGFDAGGAPAGPPVALAPSADRPKALRDEPDLAKPVRSFRYAVDIDCTDIRGVLDESPVFESIWITFRRRGYAPAWTAWSIP